MSSAHPIRNSTPIPACPACGSRESVVRMASSLTPFERPDPEDTSGRFYCRACSHDFVPDLTEDED